MRACVRACGGVPWAVAVWGPSPSPATSSTAADAVSPSPLNHPHHRPPRYQEHIKPQDFYSVAYICYQYSLLSRQHNYRNVAIRVTTKWAPCSAIFVVMMFWACLSISCCTSTDHNTIKQTDRIPQNRSIVYTDITGTCEKIIINVLIVQFDRTMRKEMRAQRPRRCTEFIY